MSSVHRTGHLVSRAYLCVIGNSFQNTLIIPKDPCRHEALRRSRWRWQNDHPSVFTPFTWGIYPPVKGKKASKASKS
jgi:hypothetical protein